MTYPRLFRIGLVAFGVALPVAYFSARERPSSVLALSPKADSARQGTEDLPTLRDVNPVAGDVAGNRGGYPTKKVDQSSDVLTTTEWTPAPDSPCALMEGDGWGTTFAPTYENMVAQLSLVPIYKDYTSEQFKQAWGTPGFSTAWALSREMHALRTFIGSYSRREYLRWEAGQPSTALETELQPVVNFIAGLPNSDSVWLSINSYSTQVINQLHSLGSQAENRDAVPAKWALHDELIDEGAPAMEVINQTLTALK